MADDLPMRLAAAVALDRPEQQPPFQTLQHRARQLRRRRLGTAGSAMAVAVAVTVTSLARGAGPGPRQPGAATRTGAVLAFSAADPGTRDAMYRDRLLALTSQSSDCPAEPVAVSAPDRTHLTVRYAGQPAGTTCSHTPAVYVASIRLPALIDVTKMLTVRQDFPHVTGGPATATVMIAAADPSVPPPSLLPCKPQLTGDRLLRPFRFDSGEQLSPDPVQPYGTASQILSHYRRAQRDRHQPVNDDAVAFRARIDHVRGHRGERAWVVYSPAGIGHDAFGILTLGSDSVVVLQDETLQASYTFTGRSTSC